MTQRYGSVMAKFSVNLPDKLHDALQLWADAEGRPKANLASFLLELAIRQKFPEKFPPQRVIPAEVERNG